MSYTGFVCALKDVRQHPNADRMKLATVFGNTICVGLDYADGMVGVYFPTDGQLSEEFCRVHDLVRRKNPETGEYEGGYMDPNKRNVKTIKLRGEPSDGLFMPISCLDYCFEDGCAAGKLSIGDTIDVVNGHEICCKYIPRSNRRTGHPTEGNRTRKRKVPIAPLFAEHADTEQLAYNLGAFRSNDEVEITLKMHGTSGRTAYLPVFQKYKRTLWDKIRKRIGTPIYDWGYVSGTRRTVIEGEEGGYYGSHEFRIKQAKAFEGKLQKGETVYYEIVGFTHDGGPIMAECSNKKVNDKAFVKQYGETTVFSYGCEPKERTFDGYNDSAPGYQNDHVQVHIPQSDIYVYRMTMTNEDGFVVEYTPDFMRYRCEQMGVKCVPVFWKGTIPDEEVFTGVSCEFTDPGEWILQKAEEFYDGPDPVGKTHIREGVVCRILNKPKFCAYKHKNLYFKILEGIVKESALVPDMEEADGLPDTDEAGE